jgi:hypothetical protein
MATAASLTNNRAIKRTEAEVASVVELFTKLLAPPEIVWPALRNFDSNSTRGLLKILEQESYRKLVYSVSGLPKTIKSMVCKVQLEPHGEGTKLHWSVIFTTKPTMFARFLRPLMRAGICRTLRDAANTLNAIIKTE